jgi:hypothetical protein
LNVKGSVKTEPFLFRKSLDHALPGAHSERLSYAREAARGPDSRSPVVADFLHVAKARRFHEQVQLVLEACIIAFGQQGAIAGDAVAKR